MPRVVHFEIYADNPERALEFYGKVFGWKAQKWPGPKDYWFLATGTGKADEKGIDGAILKREGPGVTTVNSIDVPDLDKALEAVVASGGEIALPKTPIPGMGWLAYGKDPEGNLFGMHQTDPDSK